MLTSVVHAHKGGLWKSVGAFLVVSTREGTPGTEFSPADDAEQLALSLLKCQQKKRVILFS